MPHLSLSATVLIAGVSLCAAHAAAAEVDACVRPLAGPTATLEADAQQAFREHRYAAAYGRYVRLADAGHSPSAERALFMWLNGPGLFGADWSATEPQQACWNALLATRARERMALSIATSAD